MDQTTNPTDSPSKPRTKQATLRDKRSRVGRASGSRSRRELMRIQRDIQNIQRLTHA